MRLVDLEIIKKVWKNKLINDFNPDKETFNIYIDSPFCFAQKCKFCCYDPNIITSKEDADLKDKYYSEILIKNIQDFKEILSIRKPDSAYFGGGSSSLMSCEQMEQIFNELQKYFDFKNLKEKTFEMNPLNVTEEKLKILKEWNFTNLSIGIQTFNEDVLKFNKRVNPTLNRLKNILKMFEDVTFQYNVDFMTFIYGGDYKEDLKILEKDLEIATTIIKPTRITIFPNYFQLADREFKFPSQESFEKVKALRNVVKKFDKEDYEAIGRFGDVKDSDYRINYLLVKKGVFKGHQYNSSAWYDENYRSNKQSVLAFGGYLNRRPYSYISDKFCYHTINTEDKTGYDAVFADIYY